MPAWFNRVILFFGAIVAVGILVGLAVVLKQTQAEYVRMREVEAQTRRRLAEVETRLTEQKLVLERLQTDPAFVESVIRRRLGYAKPDEFVFRFDE